jgi:hypothetical protein
MSGLGDKIKVERLDSARLARIEDNVLAARELPAEVARPGWLRFAPLAAAACALLLVAGALGFWLRSSSRSGEVAGKAPVPAITTGPGEGATVAVGDAIVTIRANSQVSFRTHPDGRIDLDLERGVVDCDVTPRPHRPVFAVHAADVDVAVVGTAFSVSRSGSQVTVQVSRGKVSVTRGGKQMYVAAGENWPAGTRVAAAEPEPEPEPDRVAEPERGTEPDRDPDPHPVPGAEHHQQQKTGDRQQTTGDRQQATGSKKTTVVLPAGLPARHSCSTENACWDIVRKNYRDDAAAALYTLIRLDLDRNDVELAGKHAELYLRRFPKGKEAAAVKRLKEIAGGD